MTEAAQHADFSNVRYAQCWEDADVLLGALEVQPGHVCLSIASAGDNALALLSRNPVHVIAVDLNPAQLACLELRVAAYRELEHSELLELMGSRPSTQRAALYLRCRKLLSSSARAFWDNKAAQIEAGIGGAGKFERYFATFRTRILPLVHSRRRVNRLLAGGSLAEREDFYAKHWDTLRWRLLFKIFFSRFVMGRFGRDPAFFRYVEGSVAERILSRTRFALTALNPAGNPYLQWILTGTHTTALPYALRPENFDSIRRNLDRLEWAQCTIEEYLEAHRELRLDRLNLSDIFEYMSQDNYQQLLERILLACNSGARLAYWNMLVPRSRPETLAQRLRPREDLAKHGFEQDKAWFYSRFVVEEVIA
jgi:S-adenosylmethionine-diacylglycerol 3-amino-3-carboxypropyl transferase